MKKYITLIITLILLITPIYTKALSVSKKSNEKIYLFYGRECPHCEELMKYLDELFLDKKYKDVKLEKYEVWHNKENNSKLVEVAKILKEDAVGVPYMVIGTNVVQGFSDANKEEVKAIIDFYLYEEYFDPAGDYLNKTDTSKLPTLKYEKENKEEYDVPVLGKINAKNVSLLLVSVIIGAVDGFNPCAMWILLFLLSLLISTKDRKKMWILGCTFLFTSAFVYFLFMMGFLRVATFLNTISILKYSIAAFALIFGGYNVYRYIKTRKDAGCDVVNKDQRKKIMTKTKKVVSTENFALALIGIMVLAVSVNLLELLCSLGLPVVFTEILSINNIKGAAKIIYILIYVLFFLIDDLLVFFIAMKTLKITAISNKYTKYSHLIGGIIMIIIGLLMLFKYEWLMFNF